jgi:hypothetical protein
MGNIYVDDARTLMRFWKKWGKKEKFVDTVTEVQWSREETLSGRYNVKFIRVLDNYPQGCEALLSGGEMCVDRNGPHIFFPSFRHLVPQAYGAFLAALGGEQGDLAGLRPDVDRGKHIGEVWLKFEELFPQSTLIVTTATEITFGASPIQPEYWDRIKHLIPFDPTAKIAVHGSSRVVSYFNITAITEGAFIWTTKQ